MLMKPIQTASETSLRKRKSHPPVDRAGLDDFVGYRLRLAYIAISRHFAKAMQAVDLTQKQTGVLWLIAANGGVSQIALARELGMDRASMMAIIDRLQDRGLIVRERSQHDGRRQELYLTAKGRKTIARARKALDKHEHWISNRFTAGEVAELVSLLGRIQY